MRPYRGDDIHFDSCVGNYLVSAIVCSWANGTSRDRCQVTAGMPAQLLGHAAKTRRRCGSTADGRRMVSRLSQPRPDEEELGSGFEAA